MKTLMFFSYKGGSGRTVAVANVAAALALLGKNVLVIDLDFEAPGLQHVFGASEHEGFDEKLGIQHYLKGRIDLASVCEDVIVDLISDDRIKCKPQGAIDGQLLFLRASTDVVPVNAEDGRVNKLMVELRNGLAERYELDYIIIDSASGVRDAFGVAMDVSDEMLMFFRWTQQHIEGTLRMSKFLKILQEFEQRSIPFRVVANATPDEDDFSKIRDKSRREEAREVRKEATKRIEKRLAFCKEALTSIPSKVFFEIGEITELKWQDYLHVYEDEHSVFLDLARKITAEI